MVAIHPPWLPCLARRRDVRTRRCGGLVGHKRVALCVPRFQLFLGAALQLRLVVARPVEDDVAAETRLEDIVLVENAGAEITQIGLGYFVAPAGPSKRP